jgi:hypothetical protein
LLRPADEAQHDTHAMSHAAKTPPIVWVLVADEAIWCRSSS